MQYMLMIYSDAAQWSKLPTSQVDKVMQAYGSFMKEIVESGHMRGGARLHPAATATTVLEKQGKAVTKDGPFAETKEQLGGFFLVECQNLDEALVIARRIPSIVVGDVVEVRPVMSSPAT